MAMTPKLELRQGQALVMTPQLQQAIKLLQMSSVELGAFVEAELERNPLLERDEASEPAPAAAEPSEAKSDGGEDAAAGEAEGYEAEDKGDGGPAPGQADSGWASMRSSAGGSFQPKDDFDLASLARRETTLHEHLTEQLNLAVDDAGDRLIGIHIIGMIDETGYVAGDVQTVAETLGTSVGNVERVLRTVQDFDPPGIGARNLKECLAIQLRERRRFDPAMEALIANLELIAKRDLPALQKACGVDRDDILEMIQEIKTLDPKPGNAFGALVVQPVVPDVVVRAAPDGSWLVELNSETLPRVLVNQQYYARVTRGAGREEDKVYLNDCLSTAQWLVKSLDQRARTILKVAREIVRQQDGFLVEGVKALRPLNLKTVADAISMHESTVSRVTSNKYMATPRGTFELKYFFTTAVGSDGGEDAHSAEAVRHRIREMIAREPESQVLSDDVIVEMLKEAGIAIARRTVAKYREAMGIPSSVQRRRDRRMGA
ncbi:MAG TPA: RNA polymerase factor sigma-54 [Aestuariivirgaceae bacterium]|nr:RNA polymerase factor sigma-54 [Aestuariivirgaceae bacterium]